MALCDIQTKNLLNFYDNNWLESGSKGYRRIPVISRAVLISRDSSEVCVHIDQNHCVSNKS